MFRRFVPSPSITSPLGTLFSRSMFAPSSFYAPPATVFVTGSASHIQQLQPLNHIKTVGVAAGSRHNKIAGQDELWTLTTADLKKKRQEASKELKGASNVIEELSHLPEYLHSLEKHYPSIKVIFSFGGALALPYDWLSENAMQLALNKQHIYPTQAHLHQAMGCLTVLETIKDFQQDKTEIQNTYQDYLAFLRVLVKANAETAPGTRKMLEALGSNPKYQLAVTTAWDKATFDLAAQTILDKEQIDLRCPMSSIVTSDMVGCSSRKTLVNEAFKWMVLRDHYKPEKLEEKAKPISPKL